MNADRHIWQTWAQRLHRWGLGELTATMIEACGPLTILGAQVVYLCQPVLDLVISDEHLDALARMLENTPETHAFVTYLREATLD
jgi:hypothetical protein